MTTEQVLAILKERGLRLVLGVDGEPRLCGPASQVTPMLKRVCQIHREWLKRFAEPYVATPPPEPQWEHRDGVWVNVAADPKGLAYAEYLERIGFPDCPDEAMDVELIGFPMGGLQFPGGQMTPPKMRWVCLAPGEFDRMAADWKRWCE